MAKEKAMSSMSLNESIKNCKKTVLEIEYVPLEELIPNTYNPNVHNPDSFDLLTLSVSAFGFTQPIVVRRETNEIIDGEHRWRVAGLLGYEKVPVCYVQMTDEEMRLATIMHNRARGRESGEMISKLYADLKRRNPELRDKMLLIDRKVKE